VCPALWRSSLPSQSSPPAEADRQLPLGEEIFLDHVGHFVRDPDAAARALMRAGFAPAPVSIQVATDSSGVQNRTGTGNVTAMFTRGYIEMLFKTADTAIGRELDVAMGRYPGIHLAAFAVADAASTHARVAANGFRVRPLVEFQRPVETGEGSGTAAFTVARVQAGEMPEGRIQVLTHHTENMVWQPRWLSHPNGALALTSITIVVGDVIEAAARFGRFTARKAISATFGQTIQLDRGRVDLVTPDAFREMLPDIAIPSLPFMGAYGIKVKLLAALQDTLVRGGLKTRRSAEKILAPFPEELGHGAWSFGE
jgi:Glyoxalase-like domain